MLLETQKLKTWWLLAWQTYYPSEDNFIESFYSKEEAEQYILAQIKIPYAWSHDSYEIKNIQARLTNA